MVTAEVLAPLTSALEATAKAEADDELPEAKAASRMRLCAGAILQSVVPKVGHLDSPSPLALTLALTLTHTHIAHLSPPTLTLRRVTRTASSAGSVLTYLLTHLLTHSLTYLLT